MVLLDTALALVDAVADSGAHALKLQTYTADTMTLDWTGRASWSKSPAACGVASACRTSTGAQQRREEMAPAALRTLPSAWPARVQHALRRKRGGFSRNPGRAPATRFLPSECTDVPLIRRVARTGQATDRFHRNGFGRRDCSGGGRGAMPAAVTWCCSRTSTYPAAVDINLRAIPTLRERFGCPVGLSDHTLGIGVAVASVALGAVMVEKHVTLSRAAGAVDAGFSLEPAELAALVAESERAWRSLGRADIGCAAGERPSLAYRRSLYVAKDIGEGEVFSAANVRAVRPGFGLPPGDIGLIVGRRAVRALRAGEPMSWEWVEGDRQAAGGRNEGVVLPVSPFDMGHPYAMESWLLRFHRMHEQLKVFADGYDGRLLTWEAYDYRLQGYFMDERIVLTQAELRLGWQAKGAMFSRLEWGSAPAEEVAALGELFAGKVAGFAPDVVILLTAADWLKPVFPDALFLHAEATWLYAPPHFDLWQLDPVGFGKGRALVDHRAQWLAEQEWSEDRQGFCRRLKRVVQGLWPAEAALKERVEELRGLFRQLVLLPLGDHAPSDGETPTMSILDWYLERSDSETAFLVTYHPNAPALHKGHEDYLTSKY